MRLEVQKEQDYENNVTIEVKCDGLISAEDMSTIQDSANTIIAVAEKYFAEPKQTSGETNAN